MERASSNASRHRPAPLTTASRGGAVRLTGTSASWEMSMSRPCNMPPPPVSVMPFTRTSCTRSGGEEPMHSMTVAAPDLRPFLARARKGRANSDLDLLGGPLADGDGVLAADVVLDRGVEIE